MHANDQHAPDNSSAPDHLAPDNPDRRAALRKLAAGAAAVAGCSLLPEKWTPPFAEIGALPAHATTSGAALADSAQSRGFANSLTIADTGQIMHCDKIMQHKIVFPKLGPQYGRRLLLVWSDGNELAVPNSAEMAMNAHPRDYRKYQPGGRYSGHNRDIPTMEVYAKRGTHPSSVTLYY